MEGGSELELAGDLVDVVVEGEAVRVGVAGAAGDDWSERGREQKKRHVAAYSYISSSDSNVESQMWLSAAKPRKLRIS